MHQSWRLRTMNELEDDPILRLNKGLIFAIVVGIAMWYGIIWLIMKWVR